MFIDKGKQLFQLNQLYQQKGIQIVSLYAHPGMGKSSTASGIFQRKTGSLFQSFPCTL